MSHIQKILPIVIAAGALSVSGQAGATTLDFDTLPSGTVAVGAYSADGVTIDAGNSYLAEANISVVTGVNNDICGQGPTCYNLGYYPTQETTIFNFSSAVSNLTFTFDNYGYNGTSYYDAFGSGGLISSANISNDQGVLEIVPGSGITELLVSNGGNDWIYGIDNLSFTAGAVPEPASWALMLTGFGLVGYTIRKRTIRTTVAYS